MFLSQVAFAIVLPESLLVGRGVAYAPTNFDPTLQLFPDDASIAADLEILYAQGFRTVVTYASDGTLDRIPRLAKLRGFERVYMGVFCPTNAEEVAAAIAASSWVDGYVAGNEGLGEPRAFCPYDTLQLAQVMRDIRAATGKPVTTSEQAGDYLAGAFARWLLEHGDWLFPNAHPFWAGARDAGEAVAWTTATFVSLAARSPVPVLLKETGLPSAGCAECMEEAQATFYRRLEATRVRFFFFEAFDQAWKTSHPVEPHWGINRKNREPKLVGVWLPVERTPWGRCKALYR